MKTLSESSNLSTPTMRIKFEYNGIEYYPKNTEKKLKELGISWDDINIIKETKVKPVEIIEERNDLYYFVNPEGESITSIYAKCPTGYKPCTLNDLKKIWIASKMKQSIKMLNELWNMITEFDLQDSQEVLNWLDSINEISVRN